MKFTYTFLLFFLLYTTSVQAQWTFGVRMGGNLSTLTPDVSDQDFPLYTKPRVGAQLGATLDYALTDRMSLRSGMILSQKGASIAWKKYYQGFPEEYEAILTEFDLESFDDEESLSVFYLELPINFSYSFGKISAFAGPYFAAGVFGMYTFKESGQYNDGESFYDFYREVLPPGDIEFSTFDYGINAGVSIQFLKNFEATLTFSHGFNKVWDYWYEDQPFGRNQMLTVSVGYLFTK